MKYHLPIPMLYKKYYGQRYEKTLMRWGSGLFWVYTFQCMSGILLAINYCAIFDFGLFLVIFIWWETLYGSMLIRLHSEIANILFLFIFLHMLTKFFSALTNISAVSFASWLSGSLILVFSYIAGATGAIMPCSTLSEVTATIVGSMLASVTYIRFNFLDVLLVPSFTLNDETIWRTFVIHAVIPLSALGVGFLHMLFLHRNKYSAAAGFKRLNIFLRFNGIQRLCYAGRYWIRAHGTWIRIFLWINMARISNDLFWPYFLNVSYSMANFEFWPMNEYINFVLIIPHWYLRAIMGALVTIPHHYLGFIYVGLVFANILFFPWLTERILKGTWQNQIYIVKSETGPARWNSIHNFNFYNFFMNLLFTAAIVPTGKYFVTIGSMDNFAYAYWIVLLYLLILVQIVIYWMFLNASALHAVECYLL